MLNSLSLVRSILGPTRCSILPLAYAMDITAERIFIDHVSEKHLKLCDDVCYEVAKRLNSFITPKSVTRSVERCTNRCWNELVKSGRTQEYIGKVMDRIENPRSMVIYLATLMYFEKPYFQMIAEHPEIFAGRNPAGLAAAMENPPTAG